MYPYKLEQGWVLRILKLLLCGGCLMKEPQEIQQGKICTALLEVMSYHEEHLIQRADDPLKRWEART